MKITFNQYIANPMNSAVMTATMREAMRNSYTKKFDAILLREHGKFNFHLYKDEDNNRYYAHFKIPSETIKNFYYDTVIEFYTDNNVKNGGEDLFSYYVKFYSNDPGFVYTYAYVFNRNDLYIKDFNRKMSKRALRDSAKVKNPSNQVGYVKTIYFAYLYMKLKSLNKLSIFKAEASVLNINNLVGSVEDADKKITEREQAGEKLANKKRIERNKEKRQKESQNIKVSKSSLGVKKTKTTKTTASSSKFVKTTSKTKRK